MRRTRNPEYPPGYRGFESLTFRKERGKQQPCLSLSLWKGNIIPFLHQTTTGQMLSLSFEKLYIIPFLHQTTTRRECASPLLSSPPQTRPTVVRGRGRRRRRCPYGSCSGRRGLCHLCNSRSPCYCPTVCFCERRGRCVMMRCRNSAVRPSPSTLSICCTSHIRSNSFS